MNGTIKRIDPMGRCRTGANVGQPCDHPEDCCVGMQCGSCRRNVTAIALDGPFPLPSGMTTNSDQDVLYFTAGINGESIESVPLPGGGTPTTVRDVSALCLGSSSSGSRGLVITNDDKLVVGRKGCISGFDPASPTSPMFELWRGFSFNPLVLALGSDVGGEFIVAGLNGLIYRIPKPSLYLNSTGGAIPERWVVDFPEGTDDCLGVNVMTLRVKFIPSTLVPYTSPRQTVTWRVEDPDDPSGDGTIDDNGNAGGDNFQTLNSYVQWEEVPGFPMTGSPMGPVVETEITLDSDGTTTMSEVRFHLSCQPGDNFRFEASLTVPVYGVVKAATGIITVWRRLHIEGDSMGLANGPFQDDDAVVEDIPDPIFDFLAEAFRPAYIEVVLPPDTGYDTGDVQFQYNVDGYSTLLHNIQANEGRGSTSSKGHWVVYVREGYEGDLLADNDPNGEIPPIHGGPLLGQTGGDFKNSLIFSETVRDVTRFDESDSLYTEASNCLHEFGHQFAWVQHDECIMGPAPILNPVFCAAQIRRIRGRLAPGLVGSP